MADQLTQSAMLDNLRTLLREVFQLRREGTAYARLARAHGYVDGYMRVLLEAGVASQKELLQVVADERGRADGPATAVVDSAEAAA